MELLFCISFSPCDCLAGSRGGGGKRKKEEGNNMPSLAAVCILLPSLYPRPVLACFEIMSLSNSHDTICHRPTSFFSLGDRLFVTWNLEAIDIFSKQAVGPIRKQKKKIKILFLFSLFYLALALFHFSPLSSSFCLFSFSKIS